MAKAKKSPGKSGPDTIIGTNANEHLNGGAREDFIDGRGGDDFINSGAKNDTVNGGAGNDRVELNSGDDLGVYVAAENKNGNGRYRDVYDGGSGIDTLKLVLTMAEYANPVLQQEIADYLAFIKANTLPNGQAKNVEYTFKSLNLVVTRFEKLEIEVDGKPVDPEEPDFCISKFVITESTVITYGTDGNDMLIAGPGPDTVFGGAGDDVIAGRGDNDQLSGGAGNDTIAGDGGNEIICGGTGDDFLLGNRGNDQVYGGKGNDTVRGGEDDDIVDGGDGDDFVGGDEGNDTLYGGAGNDIFLYGVGVGNDNFGHDVIKDFDISGVYHDRIDLSMLGTSFDTFTEVMAVATQTSAGVLFQFAADRSLLLENVTLAHLSNADFIF